MSTPVGQDPAVTSSQLLALLSEATPLDEFLDRVVHLATQLIAPPAACGLTMCRDGRLFTRVATGDVAARVDEIQYVRNCGPCVDTLRTGVVVQVDDYTGDDRWDGHGAHALADGVVSSLSLPLVVGGRTVAALNLYADRPGAFAGAPRRQAEAFAGQCAAALTLALRQSGQAEVRHQLLEAMASRSVIDQAIGILMGQQRCTATTAFGLLRRASQARNRKLHDVAADVITSTTGEPPQPPAAFGTA